MAKSAVPRSTDDYDPLEVIKELSDNINQPDKFAEIFCSAARSQKKIDDVLRENITMLLLTNNEIKAWIQSVIKEQNRTDLNVTLKKIAFSGWTLFVFLSATIFGAICTAVCSKYIR